MTTEAALLSPECEGFLESQDCYGIQSVLVADEVCIHDADGDRVFTVTKAIDVRDLRTAYFHGRGMYDRGVRGGKSGMQEALRALINAAPLEAA